MACCYLDGEAERITVVSGAGETKVSLQTVMHWWAVELVMRSLAVCPHVSRAEHISIVLPPHYRTALCWTLNKVFVGLQHKRFLVLQDITAPTMCLTTPPFRTNPPTGAQTSSGCENNTGGTAVMLAALCGAFAPVTLLSALCNFFLFAAFSGSVVCCFVCSRSCCGHSWGGKVLLPSSSVGLVRSAVAFCSAVT